MAGEGGGARNSGGWSARVRGVAAICKGGREGGALGMGGDYSEGKRGKLSGAMMAQVRLFRVLEFLI